MLVTFLARLGGEEGGGERGSWKRREKVSLERAISRAVSALSQEADVASGNDVDGRLSLSSANNIQHRPVYTHPIYLHRGFLPLRARASLVERAWKREPCACTFAAYLCVCAFAPQLSRVRVVHAHNRFAAPRRSASFSTVASFSVFSSSKGTSRIVTQNLHSFDNYTLFDCYSISTRLNRFFLQHVYICVFSRELTTFIPSTAGSPPLRAF